jgi:hypothetical protein
MAADFELIPLYGRQPIVRNRARILADRVTRSPANYLDASINY